MVARTDSDKAVVEERHTEEVFDPFRMVVEDRSARRRTSPVVVSTAMMSAVTGCATYRVRAAVSNVMVRDICERTSPVLGSGSPVVRSKNVR